VDGRQITGFSCLAAPSGAGDGGCLWMGIGTGPQCCFNLLGMECESCCLGLVHWIWQEAKDMWGKVGMGLQWPWVRQELLEDVMVHARSRSFQRTIIGRLRQSLWWWPPHHCLVPLLPPASPIDLYRTSVRLISSDAKVQFWTDARTENQKNQTVSSDSVQFGPWILGCQFSSRFYDC